MSYQYVLSMQKTLKFRQKHTTFIGGVEGGMLYVEEEEGEVFFLSVWATFPLIAANRVICSPLR